MDGPRDRIVMLLDLDYFYAQVEEKRNPSISDKPVVVCVYSGRTPESGVVSTANYIARRYGVTSGIPITLAKRRLKDVESVFLPMDHDYYQTVSGRIMSIMRRNADSLEQMGIDEAYMDVTVKTAGSYDNAKELALATKKEIQDEEGLTSSIGIGPNKLIAKIAADARKPNGLMVVRPEEVLSFLAPLPVGRLLGVGRKTGGRLEVMGIKTVSELAATDVRRLVCEFGDSLGTYLHRASIGLDENPVHERGESESISRIATLKEDTRELGMVLEITDRLCEDVHERLVRRGLSYRSVGIVAVMDDLSIHSRIKSFPKATNDLGILKRTTAELFGKLLERSEKGKEIRRAGVRVSGLAVKDGSRDQRQNNEQRQLTSFF
jgi:DNA polymerase IV (DinB-like DNA polymerase)